MRSPANAMVAGLFAPPKASVVLAVEAPPRPFANAMAGAIGERELRQWLYGVGLPSGVPPVREAALAAVEQQRDEWLAGRIATGELPVESWSPQQWMRFLNTMPDDLTDQRLAELAPHVDSLILILNDKLEELLGEDVTQEEAFRAADDVLNDAVAGIAEIINQPGLVNVDFQDVRTVMSEQGMAMMGSASASGLDRARIAAEQAIACPLLEGVNLAGARGVLVNISASRTSLKLRETKEVMNTIRAFAADDATIIYGGVFDEALSDELRVTVIATGLGAPAMARQHKPPLVASVQTGTDDHPLAPAGAVDYQQLDAVPAVIRRNRASTVEALQQSGVDKYDIPAFLRKQAD